MIFNEIVYIVSLMQVLIANKALVAKPSDYLAPMMTHVSHVVCFSSFETLWVLCRLHCAILYDNIVYKTNKYFGNYHNRYQISDKLLHTFVHFAIDCFERKNHQTLQLIWYHNALFTSTMDRVIFHALKMNRHKVVFQYIMGFHV